MVALPAALLCIALPAAHAQALQVVPLLEQSGPLLAGSAAQGYLGVYVADVDMEKAQALKLKEARGAVITLIDHDAPAGQVGLRVNDVVLEMDGQTVENADQLRRMLREIPAGRKITLTISRDGLEQTLAVELVDRQAIWSRASGTGSTATAAQGFSSPPHAWAFCQVRAPATCLPVAAVSICPSSAPISMSVSSSSRSPRRWPRSWASPAG